MPLNINGNIVNSTIVKTFNYKSIVNRGLVFQLDAGALDSYPETGTSWSDISGYNIITTLTNGPTFNSGNGGYIQFDGTNDTVSLSSIINTYPFTVSFWASHINSGWVPSVDGMGQLLNMSISGQRVSLSSNKYLSWPPGPAIMYGNSNHWSLNASSILTIPNKFYNIVYVIYGSNDSRHSIYINNVSYSLTNNGGSHGGLAGWQIASNGNGGEFWPGGIASVLVYNRTLSSSEIAQNYDVQKSRFGL